MALNAYRQLGMNNSAVSKSLEKLSSGFRINRAGDDAAGLAISEKMKAQITGLETASANAQDGISLIQTAEGNLGEVHDMLNRMVELATKSANGTYTSQERSALQAEVDSLLEEIDRISQSANFNGTRLLDGTMGLNANAFTLDGPTASTPDTAVDLSAKLASKTETDKTKLHLGTQNVDEVKPSFTIDLGDFAITKADAAGSTLTLTIGTTTVQSSNFTAAKTTEEIAEDLADKINAENINKGIVHNGALYTAEAQGGKIVFTYAGVGATGADTDPIDNTVTSPSAGVSLAVDTAANLNTTGMVNHDTQDVVNPVIETPGQRAGIDLTLDSDIVADGNKLTIDGKTFVFKTAANSTATATGDEILIDVTKPELNVDLTNSTKVIAEVVDQLSKQSTANFDIEAKSDGVIHIDQKTTSKETYDTYEKLSGVFAAVTPGTGEGNKLTIADNGKIVEGDSLSIAGKTYTFGSGKGQIAIGSDATTTLNNLASALANDGVTATVSGSSITVIGQQVAGGGLTLQIGDTADSFNKMSVAVNNMGTVGLGLESLKGNGIMTEASASASIDKIKAAINSVSTARAGMGALQNRLEHTINNLDVAVENLSAANSRIRDTDMAKEMMNYTKMNVLVQSAQAMLAQANQQPQSVLQLLQ